LINLFVITEIYAHSFAGMNVGTTVLIVLIIHLIVPTSYSVSACTRTHARVGVFRINTLCALLNMIYFD